MTAPIDQQARHLKYCERCGSLWLRPHPPAARSAAAAPALCPVCASRSTATAWSKRTHKTSKPASANRAVAPAGNGRRNS